jgi:hypothetical protein
MHSVVEARVRILSKVYTTVWLPVLWLPNPLDPTANQFAKKYNQNSDRNISPVNFLVDNP